MFLYKHRGRANLFLGTVLTLFLVTACTDNAVVSTESYGEPLQGAKGNRGFDPPSDLVASAVSSSEINLSWADNSTSEEGFRVERKHDGSTFYEFTALGQDVTTYSDVGRTAATTYYYRVRAFKTKKNGALQFSSYSNVANATTPSDGPTDPPPTQNLGPLRPTSDGTNNGVVCGHGNCWSMIDEGPANQDRIVIYGDDDTSVFINFDDMPLNFGSMASLSATVYMFYPYTLRDDDSEVFLQIFDATETTPLTDEVSLGSVQAFPGNHHTVGFSVVSSSDGSTWNGARMRLRFTYTRVRSPDVNHLYVDAVELTGTYNGTGG